MKTFPYAHAALRLPTRAVKGGFGHENLRRRAMLANDEAHAAAKKAGKKIVNVPGAANGKQMPPRGRARGWRAAAAAKSKGEM